ncbi:tetratricopeptide repeat protein [Leptospira sp. 96542]|nr:tetratricopeptide repeat protein [Leptospira sp. 96542]
MELVRKYISIYFTLVFFTTSLLAIDSGLMKEAKQAFSKKAYGEAIKKFTKYTDLHPQNGEAYMYLGYIYEYKKDYPKSISNFRKAAELDLEKSQRKTVLLKLALFFNYHQDWNLSAAYSSRYLKYDPHNEEMQKIYNRAVSNRGNPGANTTYIAPVKTEPKQNDPKKDHTKKTEPVTTEPEVTKTSESYEAALNSNPNNEDLRWDYALALFDEKKYDLAEKNLSLLIEKNPGRTRYHYKLGVTKLRLDDPKSAIESFERAKKNPFSKDTNVFLYYVYLNEGFAFQKLGEFNKAETSYLEAYKQLQKDPPLTSLARLYHSQSKWDECINYADKSLVLNPNLTESHMFRFVCLFESGKRTKKFETSFTKYQQSLESEFGEPNKMPDKFHLGFLKMARKLIEIGQQEKAESYFKVLEPDVSVNETREYLFYRGKNLFYLNRLDLALPVLQKVKGSSAAHYLLARIHAKKNEIPNAKEQLKLAADLNAEYWKLEVLEKDFKEIWKDPSFQEFVQKKGGSVTTPPSP